MVPGFVYQVSRQAAAGPDPEQEEFGTRILHAIVSTACFAGVYALLFGARIVNYAQTPDRILSDVELLGVAFDAGDEVTCQPSRADWLHRDQAPQARPGRSRLWPVRDRPPPRRTDGR